MVLNESDTVVKNMGPSGDANGCISISVLNSQKNEIVEEYGPNLKLLPSNNQVRELQTILRDR